MIQLSSSQVTTAALLVAFVAWVAYRIGYHRGRRRLGAMLRGVGSSLDNRL